MEDNAVFTLTLDIPGTLCRMAAPDTSHLAEGGRGRMWDAVGTI